MYSNVTDTGMRAVASLTKLTSSISYSSKVTDEGMRALSGLTKLRGL